MIDVGVLPSLYSSFRQRWTERDARMRIMDAVTRGDWTVVGPDDEALENRSPNLIQVALEDTAETASLVPSVRVVPSTGSDLSKKRANAMEQLAMSYMDMSQIEMLEIKSLLDLAGFGFFSWVILFDKETGTPRIEWRDPRTCFPETGWSTMDSVRTCLFAREVYVHQLSPEYQAKVKAEMEFASPTYQSHTHFNDQKVTLVEAFDESYLTLVAMYQTGTAVGKSITLRPVLLDRYETPGGICPVVIGQRPTLDNEPRGQFDQVVGVMQAHIRLTAMVLDYADQAVYCLSPTARILTENLEYVPVGDLKVGDALVGFDEFPGEDGQYRMWRRSHVLATGRKMLPSYRVKLADGTEFTASSEHKWLVGNSSNISEWVPTYKLDHRFHSKHGVRVVKPLDVWEKDESFAAGYLAGVLDGEGWLSGNNAGSFRCGIAQRDNACLTTTEGALTQLGFEYTKSVMSGTLDNAGGPVYNLQILGGMREILRLLMTVRPGRLLDKFHELGGAEYMGRFKRFELVPVVECEWVGTVEVVTLATSTKTLIAEGYAQHNSDIWVKDLIGQLSYGGGSYIQLGPQGSIGRVQPAVSSLTVDRQLDQLVTNIHLGGRWPKSRPGEVDQAIASAKFIEATAGMMNTVIRTMHLVMKRALEQALRIAFVVDREKGAERTIAGVLRNQQFLTKHEKADIDLGAQLRVDYGIGLGRDPAQTMVLGIQGMQTGMFSKEYVQENFEGITDVARERARIDVEQLRDMAFAQILEGLQNKTLPPQVLVDIAKARSNGEELFAIFEKYIALPQQEQADMQVQGGLAPPTMPGADPNAALPGPTPPPAEGLLGQLLGGGAPPPESIGRLSVPMGDGSFAGTTSST